MHVAGIDHYNLRAERSVLEELRAFYVDVVGLRVGHRPPFPSPGYWLYADQRAVLHLSEAAAGEVHLRKVSGTFSHVAFSCSGLAGYEARLDAHRVDYRRSEVPLAGVVQLFFNDPAGNGVELSFAPGAAAVAIT